MKHLLTILIILVVTVTHGNGSASAAPSVLKSVQYNALGRASRLTFWFDGSIRYTTVRHERKILLGFPGTRVGSPPGAVKRSFTSGHVRGVTIDRIGADSSRVTVTLREGATCRLYEPTADGALVLEVAPESALAISGVQAARGVPLPAPRKPSPDSGRRQAPERAAPAPSTAGHPGLVDIPALARTQMEQERGSAPSRREPVSGPVGMVRSENGELAGIGLLVAGGGTLVCAAGMTWLTVAFFRRRGRRPEVDRVSQPPPRIPAVPLARVDASAEVRAMLEQEVASRRTEAEADEETEQDDTIALAKTYGRGIDELELAFRLQERGRRNSTREQIERVVGGSKSPGAKVRAARKLGMGVGEVELAVQLGAMTAREAHKGGST